MHRRGPQSCKKYFLYQYLVHQTTGSDINANSQPARLTIPDYWTPDAPLAVFELIDDLRNQIWRRCGLDIQDELRRQTEPDHIEAAAPASKPDF